MADRIAIKRLTASDCTLFEAVFRKINAGNQKSINLNADILIGQLYANLATIAAATANEIPLPVTIYGPAGRQAHRITRKIIKNASYKNWRLDGEFIFGPPDDPTRYDNIAPNDLAILAFTGETAPVSMDMFLLSRSDQVDTSLHAALIPLFGNRSMIGVTSAQIAAAASAATVSDTHPIYMVADDPELESSLEDAAQGGFQGIGKLLRNKGRRPISLADLAKAKAKAGVTGHDGEGLVNAYLAANISVGQLTSYKWVSWENAVSPYDFEVITPSGQRTLIDAKSTGGSFDNPIHLSLSEIVEASGDAPYQIYRVFELTDEGGKLRISRDIGPLARNLKLLHETHMPDGIRIDGFSVTTSSLQWGDEQYVQRADEVESS
jgi:Domain of unknown function (DUF3883)